jgi:type I restriction enzyme M protein
MKLRLSSSLVNRLLEDLGYEDRQIRPKTSLQELQVNLGRRRLKYKPDYALEVARAIRWIIDAKAVTQTS